MTVTNQLANFGWEYVWHCHLLGHEENDMMRALAIAAPPEKPSDLLVTLRIPVPAKALNLSGGTTP